MFDFIEHILLEDLSAETDWKEVNYEVFWKTLIFEPRINPVMTKIKLLRNKPPEGGE